VLANYLCLVARKECEPSRGTSVPVGQRFFVSRGAPGQALLLRTTPETFQVSG
jgi:hypothetical protein